VKVKELITQLQKLDPSGELYVSGLAAVDRVPGYYDGACLRVMMEERAIEYNDTENKIVLHTMDVMDALDTEIEVRINVRDSRKKFYEDYVRGEKEKLDNIYKHIEPPTQL
jgi:hypothetical protein